MCDDTRPETRRGTPRAYSASSIRAMRTRTNKKRALKKGRCKRRIEKWRKRTSTSFEITKAFYQTLYYVYSGVRMQTASSLSLSCVAFSVTSICIRTNCVISASVRDVLIMEHIELDFKMVFQMSSFAFKYVPEMWKNISIETT